MWKILKFLASTTVPVLIIAAFVPGCVSTREVQELRVKDFVKAVETRQLPFNLPPGSKIDTVLVDSARQSITIRFSPEFAYQPFRPGNVADITSDVRQFFAQQFPGYRISIEALKRPLEQLIPNYYRKDPAAYDSSRLMVAVPPRALPVVRNLTRQWIPSRGLWGRNIGLWHSHGWYYNKAEDRWEWQRPRLFQSVEDLGPMTLMLKFLIPMLENAGANVFVPRERDIQTQEVIVDNDHPVSGYSEKGSPPSHIWRTGTAQGFAPGTPPYPAGVNPFLLGTTRTTTSDTVASAAISWTPDVPETGAYAVYVSYPASADNVTDAHYTVFHAGGATVFLVNQQIGGSTWIYLGTFRFNAGVHPDAGRVVLTNSSTTPGKVLSADAVRFGGGMGNIARNGTTSGRPRYLEGARYYLQYAGMPDTLVYSLNHEESDYRDDYQSRGEYINYLRGNPYGPNRDRHVPGLGIPMDLSLALHTDAGISPGDTVIGTLSLYSIQGADSTDRFPDGVSRMANRDLADLIQTQVVDDIRATFDPLWRRRQLKDADYSESVRPNVPSVLLELLSHQNLLDMEFMLDPRFQFTAARAIYKGMLRFLSVAGGTRPVVQPLPVSHFRTSLSSTGAVTLQWSPTFDPLEESARSDRYVVYTRVDEGGFDNGRLVEGDSVIFDGLAQGKIYSFRVTAVNDGGESFPSEILSVCRLNNSPAPVLIVNGFDRICAPPAVRTRDFAGFMDQLGEGVAYGDALNFTGAQYDFTPDSPFRSNDSPGFGASYADFEVQASAGNTFDYPLVHGLAVRQAGASFVSCSAKAVEDGMVDLTSYRLVDLILGKEKATRWQRPVIDSLRGVPFKAFPRGMESAIRRYCQAGGNLFISGAHVGSDLYAGVSADSIDAAFGSSVLKFRYVTDHASRTGQVVSTRTGFLPDSAHFAFRSDRNRSMYDAGSPDEVGPAGGSSVILRYAEDLFSAATAYRGDYGVIVFGFPFETIVDAPARTTVMKAVLNYFGM